MTIFGAESLEETSDEEIASDEEDVSDDEGSWDEEEVADDEEFAVDERVSEELPEEVIVESVAAELISISSANVICSEDDDPSQAAISEAAAAVKMASVCFIFSESPFLKKGSERRRR